MTCSTLHINRIKVEFKVDSVSNAVITVKNINRIKVEFKEVSRNGGQESGNNINRIKVEFKVRVKHIDMFDIAY